jgi:predicted Zn-dependent protease
MLKGRPPLELDLGVRADPEATALRHGGALYADGKVADAARIFGRYDSVDARVGAALAAWPDGTIDTLGALAAAHPHSSFVQLHLGLALYWARRQSQAQAAWRAATRANPDSYSAIRADDLLHPQYNRGLPTFVPSFSAPSSLAKLSPREQLAALAAGRSVRMKLLYGIALQRLGHPVSARQAFDDAVRLAPNSPDTQVAAAVGRFDKSRPARAFSRLGPLSKRYPHASTVRFHLGLLLLWLGQVEEGKRQLRLAEAADPASPLAREAHLFLQRLK